MDGTDLSKLDGGAPRLLLLTRDSLEEGTLRLREQDPRLGRWIDRVGSVGLRRQRHQFGALCRAIISQQLGAGAARSIHRRFLDLFAPAPRPDARRLMEIGDGPLRACGLSRPKIRYLRALAEAFDGGPLARLRLGRLPDDEVIRVLTELPGIGVWTAEMFLIFSLGRRDVFSVRDLALCRGVERVAGRALRPEAIERRAERWAPYRSVASLYLWKIAHWQEA